MFTTYQKRDGKHKEVILRVKNIRVKAWVFEDSYSISNNGLWPFNIWIYSYDNKVGIGFHWLKIADAHIEIERI